MDRDQLILEIKKQLREELKAQKQILQDQLPPEFKQKISTTKNSIEHKIQENPWLAVALATTVGFILAKFLYKQKD